MVTGMGMASKRADGENLEEAFQVMAEAFENVRNGHGPVFLEFSTYRWREHCGPNYDNELGYRDVKEFELRQSKDPLVALEDCLRDEIADSGSAIKLVRQEIAEKVKRAFELASRLNFLTLRQHLQGCMLDKNSKERSFAAGIKEAIFQAMQEDDEIICFGLGVTDPKGVFGTTKGLEDHFGSNRVFDTPTSENAMTGVAVVLRSMVSNQLSRISDLIFSFSYGPISQRSRQMEVYVWGAALSSYHDTSNYWKGLGTRCNSFSKSSCMVCSHSRVKGDHAIEPV